MATVLVTPPVVTLILLTIDCAIGPVYSALAPFCAIVHSVSAYAGFLIVVPSALGVKSAFRK